MNQSTPPRRPTPPKSGQSRPAGAGLGQPVRKTDVPVRRAGAPTGTPRPPAKNTPPAQNRPLIHPARAARHRRQHKVILAILVTVLLIVCMLVGLIFSELATAIGTLIDRTSADKPKKDKNDVVQSTDSGNDPATGDDPLQTTSPVGMTMSTLQKSKSDVAVGNLLLINPENAYVFPDHTPSTLVNIFDSRPYVTNDSGGKLRAYKVRNGNQILDRFALESLNRMMEAFYAEYKVTDMLVTWAHRTMAEQQDLYNLYVADYPGYTEAQIKQLLTSQVDTPGYSEHHLGTSVDIKLYSDSGVTYTLDDEPGYFAWLKENCWKYGYILRYPAEKATVTGVSYEPYHFRYVEVPHAYYMTENGLCLEEYLEQLAKTTSPDGEHLTFSVDGGNTYEVYYVKATSATVDLPVPADYPYTVSGDNQNGFIVTVTMN
jgi:D-alanyl-D-alanine carboxypeptidase